MDIKRWTGSERAYKLKYDKKQKGVCIMATQIMATPTLYGEEARKVIEEIKIMPTEKSKRNAKKLLEYFESFISEGK